MRFAAVAALLAAVGCADQVFQVPEVSNRTPCVALEVRSVERLTSVEPPVPSYRWPAAVGGDPHHFIGRSMGLTTADSSVLLWDVYESSVTVLSSTLQYKGEFGRRGEGPGELNPSRQVQGQRDWISAAGDTIWVFDGQGLHRFLSSGRWLGVRRWAGIGASYLQVLRIEALSGTRVLVAADRMNTNTSTRELAFWRVGADEIDTLPSVRLNTISDGSTFGYPSPSWSVSGDCLYVTDGAEEVLWAFDLTTGLVDTLLLPTYTPPPERESDRRARERMTTVAGVESRDLIRSFSDVRVVGDEIWLELWRPYSYRYRPPRVWKLRNGVAEEVEVPGFPEADLGGMAVATVRDSATDATSIVAFPVGERAR